jgi:Family of unknown function (DUF5681)
MAESSEITRREANGRFVPGQSGNPGGKKPGTRNRESALREALRDGEGEGVARVVIEKALAGNSAMARFVIGLLIPRARDRAIALDLPDCGTADDVLAASSATIQAVAKGEITPDEALAVTRLLEFRLKAIAAAQEQATHSPRATTSPSPHREPSPSAQRSPSPLAGEGRGEGVGAGRDEMRQQPPHPPIAVATGPSVSHSRGNQRFPLPRPAKRSFAESEGRGSRCLRRAEEIPAHLLHSTCISRPPIPLPPSLTGAALAA